MLSPITSTYRGIIVITIIPTYRGVIVIIIIITLYAVNAVLIGLDDNMLKLY